MLTGIVKRVMITHGQTESKLMRPEPGYFFVKCDGRIEKILYEELQCAEDRLNYVILYTESRKLIVYLTIKSLAE